MNILHIRCSDKRLGSSFRAMTEENFGHTYDISVPGPDACVSGDEEHREALLFFVRRFCSLIAFDKLIVTVHEDCAGCRCDVGEHELNVAKEAQLLKSEVSDFKGEVEAYIARRPADDDFSCWQLDKIEIS